MVDQKFKVGDVLKPVMDDTGLVKCHVIEVQTQTCPAGIEQVNYLCRLHTKSYKNAAASIAFKLMLMNETELEPWKHGTQSQ